MHLLVAAGLTVTIGFRLRIGLGDRLGGELLGIGAVEVALAKQLAQDLQRNL